jgi:hypothetical protein
LKFSSTDLVPDFNKLEGVDEIGECVMLRDPADSYKSDDSSVSDQIFLTLSASARGALSKEFDQSRAGTLFEIRLILHAYGILSVFYSFRRSSKAVPDANSVSCEIADIINGHFPLFYSFIRFLSLNNWIRLKPAHFGIPKYLVSGIPEALASSPWAEPPVFPFDRSDFKPADELRILDHIIQESLSDADLLSDWCRQFGTSSFRLESHDGGGLTVEYFSEASTTMWKSTNRDELLTLEKVLLNLRPVGVDFAERKVSNTGARVSLSTIDILLLGIRLRQVMIHTAFLAYDVILARAALVRSRLSAAENRLLRKFREADPETTADLARYPQLASIARNLINNPVVYAKDVFLSFWKEDVKRAASLAQAFEERGIRCFFSAALPSGRDWRRTLVDQLSSCEEVCVIVSKQTFERSDWVRVEFGAASVLDKPITPILFEGLKESDLPAYLQSYQAVSEREIPALVEQIYRRIRGLELNVRRSDIDSNIS